MCYKILQHCAVEIVRDVYGDTELASKLETVAAEIKEGVERYGIVRVEGGEQTSEVSASQSSSAATGKLKVMVVESDGGMVKVDVGDSPDSKVYAYQSNGLGDFQILDDANMPNLLWIPYLDQEIGIKSTQADDDIYKNTRSNIILNEDKNKNYFSLVRSGLGSQHHSFGLRKEGEECRDGCIWHLGLIMQGFTAVNNKEKVDMMLEILNTDAGTGLLHEGFSPENPKIYNRDDFGWANSLFSQWVLKEWL